jgi:hypothetical protein
MLKLLQYLLSAAGLQSPARLAGERRRDERAGRNTALGDSIHVIVRAYFRLLPSRDLFVVVQADNETTSHHWFWACGRLRLVAD